MTALASVIGWLLLGQFGVVLAIGLTVFGLLFGQRASAAIVLRMYKAKPLQPHESPELFGIYETLCQRANLNPLPVLHYIPSRMPNAFAVGYGKDAAVAVTDGILRMMNSREIAGILAHELTHVRCHDTKVMGIADMVSRTIAMLSRMGLFMMIFSFPAMIAGGGLKFLITGALLFFAPAGAIMLQLALSRTREFNADRGAAELTRDPMGLASALAKLERKAPRGLWEKIFKPARPQQQPAMLRTHPPTDDRIAELKEMAAAIGNVAASETVPQFRHFQVEDAKPRVRKPPAYHWLMGFWS